MGFATNTPSSMTMVATTILLGILMMDIHLMPTQDRLPVQRAIAHNTRSQSSLDSVQIARKSSKELKDLAQ